MSPFHTEQRHRLHSVVINQLDLVHRTVAPDETYPPLPVDPDAVLPFPIAGQSFKPVAGRDAQVIQVNRSVKDEQFPESGSSRIRMN
jgi:hypothetical protein